MKYKAGDKVKVRSDLEAGKRYGGDMFAEEMCKYEGKTLTIACVGQSIYAVKENFYNWTDEMFENKKYTYEDLKKSPIGTKITFENGEVLVKDDDGNYRNKKRWRDDSDLKELKDRVNTLGKIIKIEEPTYQTVYEVKQEILDEAEKRYLRGVIRPFRDKVTYIKKFVYSTGDAKIDINVENWYICLPTFPKNQMYKNMEDDKEYTLEELGL